MKAGELGQEIPLHSADSMIAASAIHSGFDEIVGIITLDGDMRRSSVKISVFFTDIQNNSYDSEQMIQNYGIKDWLEEVENSNNDAELTS